MAQIGFHRTHPAHFSLGPALAKHGAQGPELDGVSLAGAGAMGLHVLGGGRIDLGPGKGSADTSHLRPRIGGDHAITPTIGIDG